ncbi:hypothetical protein Pr1d_33300 [Bythopirellula goksoeyrii]|uniref:Uncharacterized protein n=1 Tax=Bythopirellula goksoeyrii TaxID=1400387 RepID=A0A5B9QPH0_9BACT|nr:hypothetical protein Pr1d_33300 [Bythopirellula goksoeyrii]
MLKQFVVLLTGSTLLLGGCHHGCLIKRRSELRCPTDIRQMVPWCAGEDAIFHCPCKPSPVFYGHKPTCWGAWPASGPEWRDAYCGCVLSDPVSEEVELPSPIFEIGPASESGPSSESKLPLEESLPSTTSAEPGPIRKLPTEPLPMPKAKLQRLQREVEEDSVRLRIPQFSFQPNANHSGQKTLQVEQVVCHTSNLPDRDSMMDVNTNFCSRHEGAGQPDFGRTFNSYLNEEHCFIR